MKAELDKKIKITKRKQNGFKIYGKMFNITSNKSNAIKTMILFSAKICVTFQKPQAEKGVVKMIPSCTATL